MTPVARNPTIIDRVHYLLNRCHVKELLGLSWTNLWISESPNKAEISALCKEQAMSEHWQFPNFQTKVVHLPASHQCHFFCSVDWSTHYFEICTAIVIDLHIQWMPTRIYMLLTLNTINFDLWWFFCLKVCQIISTLQACTELLYILLFAYVYGILFIFLLC